MGVLNGRSDLCHSLLVYSLFSAPGPLDRALQQAVLLPACSYSCCCAAILPEVCTKALSTMRFVLPALTLNWHWQNIMEGLAPSWREARSVGTAWHLRCSVSSMHRDASSLPSDSSNSVFPACACLFEPVMGQEWDILLQ